jgi:hypothetical protein
MDTFVLRLREPDPASGDESDRLRGVLEYISTGERHVFRGPDHLIALLTELANRRSSPTSSGG